MMSAITPDLQGDAKTGKNTFLLTALTQMFGVRGELGDLLLQPMLTALQFDRDGIAEVQTLFADRRLNITYHNSKKKDFGTYSVKKVTINNKNVSFSEHEGGAMISRKVMEDLNPEEIHEVEVELG